MDQIEILEIKFIAIIILRKKHLILRVNSRIVIAEFR